MADQKKLKFSRFVSPKGIAKYSWLDKPDTGYDGKSEPKFKVTILMDDDAETRAWCKKVTETLCAEAKAQGVKLKKQFHSPFVFPEDVDEDDFVPAEGKDKPKYDEDYKGRIFFTSKTGYQPGLIDAAKQSLKDGVRIMGGDIIRVKIEGNAYEGLGSGLSFRPVTVQLIQKNTSFSGRGRTDTDGFDEEEGYVSDDLDDEIAF